MNRAEPKSFLPGRSRSHPRRRMFRSPWRRDKRAPGAKFWQVCRAAALLALASASWAQAGDDWQIWLDQAASKGLSESTAIRVAQSFRYSCDEGRLATYFAELGGTWFVRPWLDLGLACRQQVDKRDDHWVEETRPYVDATLRWKTRLATLSDRNRLEFRHREGQRDTERYRNKLTLQYNAWEPGFGLKPYVAAEAFIDESVRLKERDRTQFTVGIRTDPDRRGLRALRAHKFGDLAMDYYLAQQSTKKDDQWTDEYIFGVQMGWNF